MRSKQWLSAFLAAVLVFVLVPVAFAADTDGMLTLSGPDVAIFANTYDVTLSYTGTDSVDVTFRHPNITLSGEPTHFDGPGSVTFQAAVGNGPTPDNWVNTFLLAVVYLADGTELDAMWETDFTFGDSASTEPGASEEPGDAPSQEPSDTPSEEPTGEATESPSESATATEASPAQGAAASVTPSKKPVAAAATKKPAAAGTDKLPKTGDATMDLWVLVVVAGACSAVAVVAYRKLRHSTR